MKARQQREIRHEVWELYGGEWMFHVERPNARLARAYAARLNAPIEGPGWYAYVRATFERAPPTKGSGAGPVDDPLAQAYRLRQAARRIREGTTLTQVGSESAPKEKP